MRHHGGEAAIRRGYRRQTAGAAVRVERVGLGRNAVVVGEAHRGDGFVGVATVLEVGVALAVCNGCQMFAELADIIPGAQDWPRFTTNQSERFEARLSMVEVLESPSLFFAGMAGNRLPIAVAHGEGYANFKYRGDAAKAIAALRFTNNHGAATEAYPFNPNGSPGGLTAVTTKDGRFTAMMPHPERVFRNVQMSWTNGDVSALSPWMQLWMNARRWVG